MLKKDDLKLALDKDKKLIEKNIVSNCNSLNNIQPSNLNLFQCHRYGEIRTEQIKLDSLVLKFLGVFGVEPKIDPQIAVCNLRIMKNLESEDPNLTLTSQQVELQDPPHLFLTKIFAEYGVQFSEAKGNQSYVANSFTNTKCNPKCRETELGQRCSCDFTITLKSLNPNMSKTFRIGPLMSISKTEDEAKQRMFQRVNKKATEELTDFLTKVKDGCNI